MKTQNEINLMKYMTGWKLGACGGAYTEEQWEDEHFQSGYKNGRSANRTAYRNACADYSATLSPLR